MMYYTDIIKKNLRKKETKVFLLPRKHEDRWLNVESYMDKNYFLRRSES